MNKTLLKVAAAALALLPVVSCSDKPRSADPSLEAIERGFRSVPDSMKLGVYWYWISDNLSKEGMIRDLEAMKAAGINRAYIGNVGIDGVPYGDVKVFTPEWWDILHVALKKATELDIEIGIFNSPGWSQSGGPWVKPGEAMRYLTSSEIKVTGPQSLKVQLPAIGKEAQDVKVIAYPTAAKPVTEKSWTLKKESGKELVSELTLDKEATIRSFSFVVETPIRTDAELFVKENGEYRSIRKIHLDRSNAALNVGFNPYAPIVISLPETTASAFRLVMAPDGGATAKVTLSSGPRVERYAEKSLAKMFQTPLPMWGDYMWEAQPEITDPELIVNPEQVVDLTASMQKDGTLVWEVPAGNWTIMRTSMLPTGVTNAPASPEATGYEIDKMSKKHVSTHFDAFIGEILQRVPEADRKSFKIVVQDSYETGGQNWTDDMIEEFKSRYGYDPVPYIPVFEGVVVGSADLSDRFLWDLRRLVADRVSYDYVGGLREVCHAHGLTTWLENYGHWGYPGEFLQYGGQSDEISGEFWNEGTLGDIENRAASSCGHIYGKKRVWAESFTSAGPVFSRYPYMMKQRGDRFFTEGINNTLLHVYVHQPYEDKNPGVDAWFGNEFNRKNTWFGQMDVFAQYLKRCNFMLQQGTYVADVAYYIGEDAPKMTGICDPALPYGYSFDYINAEVLLTMASVEDGKLVLPSGMQYRLLVLPQQETMRPEVLAKVKELVNAGLCITGPAPTKSPSLSGYPKADEEVQNLAAEIWGGGNDKVRPIGKGKLFATGTPIQDIMNEIKVAPDFSLGADAKEPVLFIHRTMADGEAYFVSNQSEQTIRIAPEFRASAKRIELWNPLTAEVRVLPEFTQTPTGTQVPIELNGNESVFIIFRDGKAAKDASVQNFPQKEVVKEVTSPWQVSFEKGKRGPEETVTFAELKDWSLSDDDRIRYFAGNATYTTTVSLDEIPTDKELYLDLGKVMVMAKVKLNGKYVGGVWTTPYSLNISEYAQKGDNILQVEVVNNWMNRLIGDQKLPEKDRKTWTPVNPWTADSPLQVSGLLGPVEIQAYPYSVVR